MDTLWGSSGADSLAGGTGNDAMQGNAGRDTVTAGSGTDQCAVDAEDPVIGRCVTDQSAPVLVVTTVPAVVTAGTTVVFTWQASDASGIASTQASIGGPSGWITQWCGFQTPGTLISGDDHDGVYALECAIPTDAPSQTYSIFISASDNFGQSASQRLSQDFVVSGGSSDISFPQLVTLSVLGKTSPGSTFTLRSRVTDETGVRYAFAWVTSGARVVDPSTMRYWFDYDPAGPQLVDGDLRDGTWEQSFTVREDTPPGDYTIWFSLGDSLGNRSYQTTPYNVTVQP